MCAFSVILFDVYMTLYTAGAYKIHQFLSFSFCLFICLRQLGHITRSNTSKTDKRRQKNIRLNIQYNAT